jgi:outer membrane receptor for ferric coprogen and ferric-rhodotorulic acid
VYPFESLEASRRGYRSYDELMTAIKNLMPEPARSIYNYSRNANTGAWTARSSIQGLASISDVVARGWEIELVANPTASWRISTNFAKVETTVSNSAAATLEFANQVMENIRKANMWGLVEGVESNVTMEGRFTATALSGIITQRAKDGAANQEQRKYRVNFVNSYEFREGRLRGFGMGGALRWQSKIATGYPVRIEYINGLPQQIPLVEQPYFGPAELNGDAWLSYTRRLGPKYRWKVQLNARNLIGSNGDILMVTNPDGQNALYRIAPERTWMLTNTFSF